MKLIRQKSLVATCHLHMCYVDKNNYFGYKPMQLLKKIQCKQALRISFIVPTIVKLSYSDNSTRVRLRSAFVKLIIRAKMTQSK